MRRLLVVALIAPSLFLGARAIPASAQVAGSTPHVHLWTRPVYEGSTVTDAETPFPEPMQFNVWDDAPLAPGAVAHVTVGFSYGTATADDVVSLPDPITLTFLGPTDSYPGGPAPDSPCLCIDIAND